MTGSLKVLMDRLVALEQTVSPDLHPYRWWHSGMALPAIYNTMLPSATTKPDECTVRDTVRIAIRIAVDPAANHEQDMTQIEEYVDLARDVIDEALATDRIGCSDASRVSIGPASDELGGENALVLELLIEAWLDRTVLPAL